MKDFFSENVDRAGSRQQSEAILKFVALWKLRYKVWASVGERGKKLFNEKGKEEKEVYIYIIIIHIHTCTCACSCV